MDDKESVDRVAVIDENHIVLRCVADTKAEFIEKAVLNGWKQCKTCKYPICDECLKIFLGDNESNEPVCPGSFLKFTHTLVPEPIPTELILIEAKKNLSELPPIGILLDRAFYSSPLQAQEDKQVPGAYFRNTSAFLAKQEQWANMGSVIVKRNHGKYVSWERMSNL